VKEGLSVILVLGNNEIVAIVDFFRGLKGFHQVGLDHSVILGIGGGFAHLIRGDVRNLLRRE